LFDEIVRPLLPAIGSRQVLVVVPDAVLQTVSFASLVDRQRGRYLVEDYAIDIAPSGTVFVRASAAASSRQELGHALIVGNPSLEPRLKAKLPNLPGAQAEAIEIARLYRSSELLVGSRATKAAFLRGIQASQIVHFAGHAASSAGFSLSARIMLAPDGSEDGALHPQELGSRSFPRTRLVVLAACRTAAGAISSVEGALSLGRPFLAAGVPSVVASLSDVDDEFSRHFFVAFHRALLSGAEPLLALRDTQLAMLREHNPALAHPAAWAGFVCMGGLDHRRLIDTPL
jgi:CHAT domain-containing protein